MDWAQDISLLSLDGLSSSHSRKKFCQTFIHKVYGKQEMKRSRRKTTNFKYMLLHISENKQMQNGTNYQSITDSNDVNKESISQ